MSDEINKTILECPKCHKKWCEVTWSFDKPITADSIRVLDGDKKFADNEVLSCTYCHYKYRDCDIMLGLAAKFKL